MLRKTRSEIIDLSGLKFGCDRLRDLKANASKGVFMSVDTTLKNLFDHWERVWHEGEYDLIPECMAPAYIRHDELGDRTVTPADYAKEIASARQARPNTRFVIYEHIFAGDRAWFRFTLKWSDAATRETQTRAGMQLYRVEAGKLAETWLTLLPQGSAWPDVNPQLHWTS